MVNLHSRILCQKFLSFSLLWVLRWRGVCEQERGINCHFVIAHTDGSLCLFWQGILVISVCEPCAPIRVLLALSRRVWIYYIIRLSVFMHERQRNRSFCVRAEMVLPNFVMPFDALAARFACKSRARAHQGLWFFTRQTADLKPLICVWLRRWKEFAYLNQINCSQTSNHRLVFKL
jgi:hypothetical protein